MKESSLRWLSGHVTLNLRSERERADLGVERVLQIERIAHARSLAHSLTHSYITVCHVLFRLMKKQLNNGGEIFSLMELMF